MKLFCKYLLIFTFISLTVSLSSEETSKVCLPVENSQKYLVKRRDHKKTNIQNLKNTLELKNAVYVQKNKNQSGVNQEICDRKKSTKLLKEDFLKNIKLEEIPKV
ncbi:MAG: hypothetical protein L6Q54_11920 [Leptospiraceae bacterium]|nr:hypothetical protein [Leptospiraceae bacterium]MCK6381937.1 hypothetical protein [Leptospiraceae bacterium]